MGSFISLDFGRDNSDSVILAKRKPSRTYRKYEALLVGRRALTKNEINSLAWALNGRRACNLTEGDRCQLQHLLDERAERPITPEQTKLGIDWLRRVAYRKDGMPRQNKSQPFCSYERAIIDTFSRFAWIGYHNRQEDYGNYNGILDLVPVWRTYARDGRYFDYYVLAGGPGGSVDVIVCGRGEKRRKA